MFWCCGPVAHQQAQGCGQSLEVDGPVAQRIPARPNDRLSGSHVRSFGRGATAVAMIDMYVYVLRSQKDGKRYVGMAHDVRKRLEDHNKGQVSSTKGRRPLEVVHVEAFKTVEEARAREKYYKSAAGRRALDRIEQDRPRSLSTRGV
jgi:putative endonuclease